MSNSQIQENVVRPPPSPHGPKGVLPLPQSPSPSTLPSLLEPPSPLAPLTVPVPCCRILPLSTRSSRMRCWAQGNSEWSMEVSALHSHPDRVPRGFWAPDHPIRLAVCHLWFWLLRKLDPGSDGRRLSFSPWEKQWTFLPASLGRAGLRSDWPQS